MSCAISPTEEDLIEDPGRLDDLIEDVTAMLDAKLDSNFQERQNDFAAVRALPSQLINWYDSGVSGMGPEAAHANVSDVCRSSRRQKSSKEMLLRIGVKFSGETISPSTASQHKTLLSANPKTPPSPLGSNHDHVFARPRRRGDYLEKFEELASELSSEYDSGITEQRQTEFHAKIDALCEAAIVQERHRQGVSHLLAGTQLQFNQQRINKNNPQNSRRRHPMRTRAWAKTSAARQDTTSQTSLFPYHTARMS